MQCLWFHWFPHFPPGPLVLSHLGLAFVLMLRPFFPELVMSTDLLSFEHPSVLLFCFATAVCHNFLTTCSYSDFEFLTILRVEVRWLHDIGWFVFFWLRVQDNKSILKALFALQTYLLYEYSRRILKNDVRSVVCISFDKQQIPMKASRKYMEKGKSGDGINVKLLVPIGETGEVGGDCRFALCPSLRPSFCHSVCL